MSSLALSVQVDREIAVSADSVSTAGNLFRTLICLSIVEDDSPLYEEKSVIDKLWIPTMGCI